MAIDVLKFQQWAEVIIFQLMSSITSIAEVWINELFLMTATIVTDLLNFCFCVTIANQ